MSERILSDPQWFGLLDRLLNAAIETLLTDTVIVQHYVSQLVNYQLAHKKRDVGYANRWNVNIGLMLAFLTEPTIERYTAICLDRGYVFAMIRNFRSLMAGYDRAYERAFRWDEHADLQVLHHRVGARGDALQTVRALTVLGDAALEVKHSIIGQFEDYIQAMARYDAKNHPLVSDARDLAQSYWFAANRAVDHFNIERGTYKSYLDQWLKKARNGDHHFYGSAFSMPSGASGNHLAVSLDALAAGREGDLDALAMMADLTARSAFDIVNDARERQRVQDLIALVDDGGYAAQALEIGDN